MSPDKISLDQKLALVASHWDPKIIGELNGQHVKLVKLRGEFLWHHHEQEDELFLVLRGAFEMQFRDRTVELHEGELIIVPRGIEHRPLAREEAHVLLFEPASTRNTGNRVTDRTVARPDWI
jgi:mannose-6-phosphate isomerase-like protein (cupin superfamily)